MNVAVLPCQVPGTGDTLSDRPGTGNTHSDRPVTETLMVTSLGHRHLF